jgi:hypothetical protein
VYENDEMIRNREHNTQKLFSLKKKIQEHTVYYRKLKLWGPVEKLIFFLL